ncbi:hypothetical protein GALL_536690 [mine drainage metagenome]|uniref:Uncharacterized protein n=1 Tax=mine drainage metagenome TaxID=410659 RepID=A0A1J5PBC3_9ZZZZ
MKPGTLTAVPPTVKEKPPDRCHKIPTKLTSVTSALSSPMVNDTLKWVNWPMSSWIRWSGLSGLPVPALPGALAGSGRAKRASSSW